MKASLCRNERQERSGRGKRVDGKWRKNNAHCPLWVKGWSNHDSLNSQTQWTLNPGRQLSYFRPGSVSLPTMSWISLRGAGTAGRRRRRSRGGKTTRPVDRTLDSCWQGLSGVNLSKDDLTYFQVRRRRQSYLESVKIKGLNTLLSILEG